MWKVTYKLWTTPTGFHCAPPAGCCMPQLHPQIQYTRQIVEVLDKVSSACETCAPAHAAQCPFYFQLHQDHGRYKSACLCLVRWQEIHKHEISFHTGRHATGGPCTVIIGFFYFCSYRFQDENGVNMHVFVWLCNRAALKFQHNILWNIYDPGLVTSCSLCVCGSERDAPRNLRVGETARGLHRDWIRILAGIRRLDLSWAAIWMKLVRDWQQLMVSLL